jgi:carotenoid cleavage dioxygenase
MGDEERITRRDLLRRGAMGGLALGAVGAAGGALLAACGSPATGTTATTWASPPTTAPPDTDGARWWLEGNYGPVTVETTSTELSVTGSLPPELTGLYVRNGSNPLRGVSPHWFLGDGMVHGVRLDGGSASWYRNRWVRTGLYAHGGGLGATGAPGGTATLSNVSVVDHGGATLTLGEVGIPYALDPADLSTVGPVAGYGGTNGNMTAHPKTDPATGDLHSFGYGFSEPFLEYRVHDASGTLLSDQPVDLPRSVMMHDFAITGHDVIFMDLPVVFDLAGATRMVADPSSEAVPFRWAPSVGARLGVMPLGGPTSAIRWVEIEPCYVYHTINAVRHGGSIVLDVCRLDSTFAPATLASASTRHRWTLDTTGARIRFTDEVVDVPPADLPTIDTRRRGTTWRHAWLGELASRPGAVSFTGCQHIDMATGRLDRWQPGDGRTSGEWLFVPGGPGEGEGWVLAFVYDAATDRSSLVVLDAQHVAAGPVAEVHLPVRVPYGFHAAFVTD